MYAIRFFRGGVVLAGMLPAIAGSAAVISPVGVTGHDGGNWGPTLGHLTDMLNGNNVGFLTGDHNPGMTVVDPADPSTWTYAGNVWKQEWKANSRLDSTVSANNKIGWAVIDLGSDVAGLDSLYLWNVRFQATDENVKDFNVYVASSPDVSLPAMPNSKTVAGDYDFASGGWALVTSATLPVNTANNSGPQGTIDLGNRTARYVGIEIISAGADANRVGLAQVEITTAVVPEPAAIGLLAAGGLCLGVAGSLAKKRRPLAC
jgi:hypothetical protein